MLRFEYPLDLQMVTVAQGRRFSSANNDAAATRGTSQQEDHVFAAINGSAFPQPGRYTLQSNALVGALLAVPKRSFAPEILESVQPQRRLTGHRAKDGCWRMTNIVAA